MANQRGPPLVEDPKPLEQAGGSLFIHLLHVPPCFSPAGGRPPDILPTLITPYANAR